MSYRNTGKRIKKSNGDKVFDFFLYGLAAIITVIVLYPMYFIIIASISNPVEVSAGNVMFYPIGVTLKGYLKLIEYKQIWIGYRNTIIYTAVGTLIVLFVNIPAAFAISRKELFGRKIFTMFYLLPMLFTGGLIPTYMVVKSLNLVDKFWVMVLPFSVITYFIIVGRTFFVNSLPDEIGEAAQIDGCGTLTFFVKIAIPLSKAVIAVIALWSAVGHWNAYFNALIYIRSADLQPLQIILRNILISNQTISTMDTGSAAAEAKQMADLIKYGVIVISSAPIMCIYPFVQKYFNQGVMLGSVKG